MGFQIVTAVVACAALLVALINSWVQLKDRWENRRVGSTRLLMFPLDAWAGSSYYFVRLSVSNRTSVDRHIAECEFDARTPPRRSAWRRTADRTQRLLVSPPALTRRGAVTVTGIGLDPRLVQSFAQFPDPLGTPFVVPASATVTGTLAFARFPWDEQTFDIIDIKEPLLYLAGGSRALSAALSLVDDRRRRSDVTVLIPWTPPPHQPAPQ